MDYPPENTGPPRVITLEGIFSPQLAKALRAVTQNLPIDDKLVVSAYIAGVSGVLKLGTLVCGNPATSYVVPANLYMAAVGDSGKKKSPVQKILVERPAEGVVAIVEEENARIKEEWEMRNMGLKKSEREPLPIAAAVHADTFTAASLMQQLEAHEERGLAKMILKDEVSSLFGRLRAANDERRHQILEFFDGKGARAQRANGPDRHFKSCHFSIYGAVQPGILQSFVKAGDPAGVWARFLFCEMPDLLKELPWNTTPEQLDEIAKSHMLLRAYVTAAHKLEPATYGFDQDGLRLFSEYEFAQQQVAQEAHLNAQRALAGKKAGKVLRVACLFHILGYVGPARVPSIIGLRSLKDAIAFVEELDAWTYAFHDIVDEEVQGGVTRLMRKIQEVSAQVKGPVSWTMVQNKMSKEDRYGVTRDSARKAMEKLVDIGMGSVTRGKRGGLVYCARSLSSTSLS